MQTTDRNTHTFLEKYVKEHTGEYDSLPNPVFIVDTGFNIVFLNKAMKTLCGLNGNKDNTKCYQLLCHSEKEVEGCPLAGSGGKRDIEPMEIYSTSLEKHLILHFSPILNDEILTGILHSVTDITNTKKAENEYRELVDIYAHALNDMKIREQKAQTGRDAFLNMLEDINESYKELEDLFIKLIRVMVNALDAKSPWTKGHSDRVSMYAEYIAMEMLIDKDEIKNISLAGILHDIGKIGTYDYLLDKPGKLTQDEFELVKKHPSQGADILKEIKQLRDIIPLVEYHHEKIDGSGYPYRLKGEKIPLGAKILHVADSFDSMTSDRPYRAAPGIEYALSELDKYKGRQFDPNVVEAFLKVLDKNKVRFSSFLK